MSDKLQQLRARLLEKENRETTRTSDNAIYAFWNIPFDTTAVIRFLPDNDESNDFFWAESQKIRLSFPGIVGQANTNNRETFVQVPCMEMWGMDCPVLKEIRPWFKDPSLEDLARKYWKKRSYIFQGFVRENPITEDDGPENPIRRLVINPSIYDIVKGALMDPEMEDMPTDYTSGVDFRITRTKQGDYANYKTSGYSRKSSSLTPQEAEAVEKYGLFTLSDFQPKQPNDAELNAITEMFEASVAGELYDPARWANFYKPAGLRVDNNTTASNAAVVAQVAPATASAAAVVDEATANVTEEVAVTETAPVVAADSTVENEVKKSPQDILADIKARAASQR